MDLDYSILSLLIDTAQSADLTRYVTEGQAEFIQALDSAEALMGSAEDQAEIDEAASALDHCWMNLRLKADESLLKELTGVKEQLEALDLNILPASFRLEVQTAMAHVNTVLQAEEPAQAEAVNALKEAEAVLEKAETLNQQEEQKKADEAQKDEKDTKPSAANEEETEKKQNPEMEKTASSASSSRSVKTAASLNGMLFGSAAAFSALLGALLKRKKK